MGVCKRFSLKVKNWKKRLGLQYTQCPAGGSVPVDLCTELPLLWLPVFSSGWQSKAAPPVAQPPSN